jgi:hypothetical protein
MDKDYYFKMLLEAIKENDNLKASIALTKLNQLGYKVIQEVTHGNALQ